MLECVIERAMELSNRDLGVANAIVATYHSMTREKVAAPRDIGKKKSRWIYASLFSWPRIHIQGREADFLL